MASAKFDIQFAGELMEDADPAHARRELQRLFRLSDEAVAQLFKGEPIIIKRGVDTATASSYRKRFREAGALVRIVPVDAAPAQTAPTPAQAQAQAQGAQSAAAQAGGLALQSPAEQGKSNLEGPGPDARTIDTSHLALVGGEGWTLEDCETAPEPIKVPDISHMALVDIDDD